MSVFLTIMDYKFSFFTKFHKSIDNILDFYYLGLDKFFQKKEYIKNLYISHKELILENNYLKEKIFLKETENLLFSKYQSENQILHTLLNSSSDIFQKKMVTRAIIGEKNLYNECSIIIDKGKYDGVYVGQPVINEKGIVGQVISVNNFTSRVILVCNTSYALSARVLRNNLHMILIGDGAYSFKLRSDCLISNADIQEGDLLVSTGLDDCFPKDYPVAIVTYVKNNFKCGTIEVESKPTVDIRKLNFLLLLWKKENY